jgi:hypothetical protein
MVNSSAALIVTAGGVPPSTICLAAPAKTWMPTFAGMTRGARLHVNLFAGWF